MNTQQKGGISTWFCIAKDGTKKALATITMLWSAKTETRAKCTDILPDTTSGPPYPGDVSTSVPSPSYQNDDFNPTDVEDVGQQDFNSEPDASMYNLSTHDQCVLFPLDLFMDIEKEDVTSVPYNINGNHAYWIKMQNMKWHKAQEDGRWFVMHSSTMRRSNSV